jgi:hypothetical protein
VEHSVWTDRMLRSLERGIEGSKESGYLSRAVPRNDPWEYRWSEIEWYKRHCAM